jgi:purine-binding chemotaxis protein CheW
MRHESLPDSFLIAQVGPAQRLIELSTVREIVPAMQLAQPPGLAGGCRGVANVRGETIPVFDVALREGPLEPAQLIVLTLTNQGGVIGVVVDDVLDLVQLTAAQLVAHPAGLGRHVRSAHLLGVTMSVLTARVVLDVA